jgi:hypothetical protein
MTTVEMMDLLTQRTKITDQAKLLRELRDAYDWAVNEIFISADGPQLLMTVGEELPVLAATTRDYDLETNLVGGSILGLQTLWAKFPTGLNFTPLIPRAVASQDFIAMDSSAIATPLIATNFPVFYSIVNDGKVRFAPALPAGTFLRADYARVGPAPDPTNNPTQQDGTDMPSIFHRAILAKATAHLFNTLDDSREGGWETRAIQFKNSAIYAAGKGTRSQRPVETRPFRRGNRRRGV